MRRGVLAILLACHHEAHEPDAHAPLDADMDDASAETQDDASATPVATWADLLRAEKWADGARAIDALPTEQRDRPEVRYARAIAAIELGDGKTAITRLENLEPLLTPLDGEIPRARARAQALVGPYMEAGEWFEKHATTLDDELAAARAFSKAGQPIRALRACSRVLANEKHGRAQETEARTLRIHAESERADAGPATPSEETIADARWLFVHAAEAQNKEVEALIAKHPLKQRELAQRATAFADQAQLDDALHTLDRVPSAPGPAITPLEQKRARGDAMMRARGRYADAATLFHQCASAPDNALASSDLLWSARALSRNDQDDDAIERYAEVIKRFPKSSDAAAAIFYSARLELLHGRWDKAAAGFDDYVAHHGGGADHDEAARLQAIAHLEKGDVKRARALLEQRAGSERDADARARMANLAAVAALRDGDRTHAVARLTDVARDQPLTWAALVARARLTQLSAPLPPTIPPASTASAEPLALALPEAVSILHRIGLDASAEEALRAREGAVTTSNPARGVEAICEAYGKVDRAKRRLQVSLQVSAAHLQNAPSKATRWAWDCAFPEPFATLVRDVEIRETLTEGLVYAVARQESAFDPEVVSPARAVGLLQLLPETGATVAREMGMRYDEAELRRAARSIALGGHYLHDLLVKAHGSLPLAIGSYNAGESVIKWAQHMKGIEIDAFVEAIPFYETRAYVVRVMGNLARYGFKDRGEEGVPKIDLVVP